MELSEFSGKHSDNLEDHIKTNLKEYSNKYSLDNEKNILKDASIKVNKYVYK